MSYYAVLDVLIRAFVVDEDASWLFDLREVSDSIRQAEYDQVPIPYLLVEFEDKPGSPSAGISQLNIPDGPLMNGGEAA
ncbi:hypothetical protein HLRTI_000478 [Halorhabdus tiamatea SARL4B]|uniref:Uncharacterized protein n=1 Tax=Halorhabdus tiamatea SARL4B TaxID=1033806 RepID=F7PLP2_9EURY|nr:hypothetical protein [Halorhabdus tiamatea]ERJ07436.1 hypothetical protein HLRTI_000478 [Halorhabdus tiamatea SARL4B]